MRYVAADAEANGMVIRSAALSCVENRATCPCHFLSALRAELQIGRLCGRRPLSRNPGVTASRKQRKAAFSSARLPAPKDCGIISTLSFGQGFRPSPLSLGRPGLGRGFGMSDSLLSETVRHHTRRHILYVENAKLCVSLLVPEGMSDDQNNPLPTGFTA